MLPPIANLSDSTELSFCFSESKGVHDEQLQTSYSTEIPCGFEAMDRFGHWNRPGPWRDNTFRLDQFKLAISNSNLSPEAKLNSNSETTPSSWWDQALEWGTASYLTIFPPYAATALGLALLSSPTGCSPAKPAPTTPNSIPAGMIIGQGAIRSRVELKGNKALGTVIFIRQKHDHPSGLFPGETSEENLEKVGSYQREILKLLKEKQPKHIFLEGLDFDVTPPNYDLLLQLVYNTHRDFLEKNRHIIEENSERSEKLILAKYGAALIYATEAKDVFLHKVMTEEEHLWLNEQVAVYRNKHHDDITAMFSDPEFKKTADDTREKLLMREVKNFLVSHPGKTVVVIYGGRHQICDNFINEDFKPHILSVWLELPDNNMSFWWETTTGEVVAGPPPSCSTP